MKKEIVAKGENDELYGGAGHDRYVIEGHDTIEDSDGIGSIRNKAGQRIASAVEKRGDGSYVFLNDFSIIASVQMRTDEMGQSRFKSNSQQQRSCRTRKKILRRCAPGHASPLPSATRNEAL